VKPPDAASTLFFEILKDLPREGPGDGASTLRALARVTEATAVRTIIDVGCGPGKQTCDLARAADVRIVALDTHRPYLDELRVNSTREGLSRRIHIVQGSMFAIPLQPETLDAVWSEGAVYIIGFERGLREWRPFVRRGGCVVVSHLSWLTSEVPDEPRKFWARNFPAMTTVDENLTIARRCGYEIVEHFALPESAWWTDYYDPLEQRLEELRGHHRGDDEAQAMIAETQEQIDLYRRFSWSYGYVFYVLLRT
jgi:SAM-dependent methyltransferase